MACVQGYREKTVTAKSVIHKAAFVRGFNDVKKGIPFDYDAYPTMVEMEHYERGRMFACVFHGELKDGKRVLWSAQSALYDAYACGAVV